MQDKKGDIMSIFISVTSIMSWNIISICAKSFRKYILQIIW